MVTRDASTRVTRLATRYLRSVMDVSSETLRLRTPSKFETFPYASPYDIQTDLMAHLYTAIGNASESPCKLPTKNLNRIAVHRCHREPHRNGENAESIDFKPDMAS